MPQEDEQRNYNPRGVQQKDRIFLEPLVDWLFQKRAHRVDVIAIDCTCSPSVHYNIDAYAEEKGLFPMLAKPNLEDLNKDGREYILIESHSLGGSFYSDLSVVSPTRMPLHLHVGYLPKDREEQRRIIMAYNKHVLEDFGIYSD